MPNICYNCFQEYGRGDKCPHCGYNPNDDDGRYPLALRPGFILNGRYTTGRVLGQGGFGITYIAQDYQTGERVAIKEYLPVEFAGRTQGSYRVQPYSGEREENFAYGKEHCQYNAGHLCNQIVISHSSFFSYHCFTISH